MLDIGLSRIFQSVHLFASSDNEWNFHAGHIVFGKMGPKATDNVFCPPYNRVGLGADWVLTSWSK